ncbi:hypothetical protein PTTG_01672, partial [Puccinia triticina 1-1 BBBD Race 1]
MPRTRSQQARPLKNKKKIPSSTEEDTAETNKAKGSIDQDHQPPETETEAKDNIQVLEPNTIKWTPEMDFTANFTSSHHWK